MFWISLVASPRQVTTPPPNMMITIRCGKGSSIWFGGGAILPCQCWRALFILQLSWCNMFSGDIPSVMITPPSTGSWSLSGATLLGLDFVSVKRDPITAIELKSCACNINGNWETTKTDLLLRQIDEFAFYFREHIVPPGCGGRHPPAAELGACENYLQTWTIVT